MIVTRLLQTSPAPAALASPHANQHLTLMSLEVFVATRDSLRADPEHDAVRAVCVEVRQSDERGTGGGHGVVLAYDDAKCSDGEFVV